MCVLIAQYVRGATEGKKREESKAPSFLFLFSQPVIDAKDKPIEDQINYFEEEAIIQKVLKEGKCRINYIREKATVDKFHSWIKQGIEILHFCGHGVKATQNYLLFES